MIEGLIQQFLGSSVAGDAVAALTGEGMSESQAKGAVNATAQGAAEALGGGGGGIAGALGGLLGGGGGGLAGALGGLMGGGGGGLLGGGAVSPEMVNTVAGFVSEKTGLPLEQAKQAAQVVLPKVIEFVKSKMG